MPQLFPFESLYLKRFTTGLYTNRSALAPPFDDSKNDALIDGLNTEISRAFTIKRRPGLSTLLSNSLAAGEIPRRLHSFYNSAGTLILVGDVTTKVRKLLRTGAHVDIHTPADTTKQWSFQDVQGTLYFANGNESKKWDGTTTTNWGIVAPSAAPTLTPQAGTLDATRGYRYRFVYKNSTTGHISSSSPTSASTGVLTNQDISVSGARSTDAQVDKVEIYRTADGGSVYFFLVQINNPGAGNWTYVDSTPDSSLGTLKAPVANENDPPPTGLKNITFHAGRMWGSVNNLVYFAGGPDILNGVPEEAWPPNNYLKFPSEVIRLQPFMDGLLVFLRNQTYIIRGETSTTFFGRLWQARLGIASYNSLDAAGDFLAVYTSDKRLLLIDPEQVKDIGFPIMDQLKTFDTTTNYVAIHADGSGNDDDSVLINDRLVGLTYRFSLTQGVWNPKADFSFDPELMQSLLVATSDTAGAVGQRYLVFGSPFAGTTLFYRNPVTFSDNGTNYSAHAEFGSFVLVPPGKLAVVDALLIERAAVGSDFSVAIRPSEISGGLTTLSTAVDEPPELSASTTVIAKKYYLRQATLPGIMRHLAVRVTFATENAASELLGLAILGNEKQVT